MCQELIDRNFGLEGEVDKALNLQNKEKEKERKKMIFKRLSEVMLKASIHFKRLNMSLEDFYAISNYLPSARSSRENLGDIPDNKNIQSNKLLFSFARPEYLDTSRLSQ